MNMKAAIALVCGLVIQLSLILPSLAATTDHVPVTEACDCCEDLNSCPCVHESEPAQKPLPLAPDSNQNIKVPLARVADARVPLESTFAAQFSPIRKSTQTTTHPSGYIGVPLSVSFCSFVM